MAQLIDILLASCCFYASSLACMNMERGLTLVPPGYLPQPPEPKCVVSENNVTVCRSDPKYAPKRVHFNPNTGKRYDNSPGIEASKNWKVWVAGKQPQDLYLEEIEQRKKAEMDLAYLASIKAEEQRQRELAKMRQPEHFAYEDKTGQGTFYYDDGWDSSRLVNNGRRVMWDRRIAAGNRWSIYGGGATTPRTLVTGRMVWAANPPRHQ